MPALPPVQAIKCECKGVYDDTNWVNIFHVAYTGGAPSATALNSFATAFAAAFAARFLPYQNSAVDLNEVKCIDLSSSTGAEGFWTGTDVGSGGGTGMPASVAYGVSWLISRRYRGGHPRTYLQGVDSSHLLAGSRKTLAAALVTNLTTDAGGFIGDVAAIGSVSTPALSCVSYYSAKALRSVPLLQTITAAVVHPRVDSQRRRTGKESTL